MSIDISAEYGKAEGIINFMARMANSKDAYYILRDSFGQLEPEANGSKFNDIVELARTKRGNLNGESNIHKYNEKGEIVIPKSKDKKLSVNQVSSAGFFTSDGLDNTIN